MTAYDRTDVTDVALAGLDAAALGARLADAIAAARIGRPVVYPTETVYGVGSAISPEGVEAVRAAKRRPDDKPVLALVGGVEAVPHLAWTEAARELADVFWPGAVTLVLADPERSFPPGVRSPAGTVAIRHTSHPIAAALVEGLGAPITSSSANRPGEAPALDSASAAAFAQGLVDDGLGQPWFVDAGALPATASSTLIDCTAGEPRVLRAGAVPVDRLRCVLPGIS